MKDFIETKLFAQKLQSAKLALGMSDVELIKKAVISSAVIKAIEGGLCDNDTFMRKYAVAVGADWFEEEYAKLKAVQDYLKYEQDKEQFIELLSKFAGEDAAAEFGDKFKNTSMGQVRIKLIPMTGAITEVRFNTARK